MPHWRSMQSKSSDVLRAADLWDDKSEGYREVVVQIERVTQGTITGEKGRKDKMPFAFFKGTRSGKPLGLNASNCKTLVGITGTPNASKWAGAWITLYVTQTENANGEIVDCIRIRPKAARPSADNAAVRNDNAATEEPPHAGE